MTYGIQTFTASGDEIFGPSKFGCVFVEVVSAGPGVTVNRTYPSLVGRQLLVLQVQAVGHDWVTGTNGSNQPTLTVIPVTVNPMTGDGETSSILLVFAQ